MPDYNYGIFVTCSSIDPFLLRNSLPFKLHVKYVSHADVVLHCKIPNKI